jgi:hypothetical protein
MYTMLTAKFTVVSRSASRCSAGTSKGGDFSVFPAPPQPARAARLTGAAVSSPGGVRSQVTSLFQGRCEIDLTEYRAPWLRYAIEACTLVPRRACSDRQAASLPPQITQTGRRLMRQTVLPALQGLIPPMRGASRARRCPSRESCSVRRFSSRFGLPLTPESGGPSRHPAVRFARAALRARRRQEFQNAQQNAYRCHPPGGDPGRCGPRQPRRRI